MSSSVARNYVKHARGICMHCADRARVLYTRTNDLEQVQLVSEEVSSLPPQRCGSFLQSMVLLDTSMLVSTLYPLALQVTLNLTAVLTVRFNTLVGFVHRLVSFSDEQTAQ